MLVFLQSDTRNIVAGHDNDNTTASTDPPGTNMHGPGRCADADCSIILGDQPQWSGLMG